MLTLKDYVNWGITHSDKTGSAEGVPLVMENCVKNKKMKQFEVYGNSIQNGTPTPENPIEVESVGEFDADVGKYKVPVTVRGKNLVDYRTARNRDGYSNGKIELFDNGVTYTGNYWFVFECPKFKIGSTYVFSAEYVNSNGISPYWYVYYSDGDTYGAMVGKPITITKEVAELRLYVATGASGATISALTITNPMLEESEVKSEYEPYTEPITTNVYLDEPLRKIGDYADVLDFKNKKVVRSVKAIAWKGGEVVSLVSTYESLGYYMWRTAHNTYPELAVGVTPGYSTHFVGIKGTTATEVIKPNNWYVGRQNGIAIMLAPEAYASDGIKATMADINAWLKSQYDTGNPVTFYCQLNAVNEEPIECELPTLTAKTSIVEIDTALLPSNIKGKYIKR